MAVSSLLKSAASTRKKILSQQDAIAAFEWENSAQTYDDLIDYSSYLENRLSTTGDVGDQLSYETKLRSARRSYTSNELQRQQLAIMQGSGDTQTKLDKIVDLYYQAVDNDDLNLAQNLMSQYSSLSITLQNEQEAAIKSFRAAGDKAATTLLNDLTKGVDDVKLPTGQMVTPLAQLNRIFKEEGDTARVMKAAEETMEALREVIIDQYNNATTQEQIDKLEEKYGAGLADINETLTFKVGGKTLKYQDVVNAVAQDTFNNPVYSLQASYDEATGATDFKLKENNIDRLDYIRQFDPQTGEEFYTPISVRTDQSSVVFGNSDVGRGLDAIITDEGAIAEKSGNGKAMTKMGTEEVETDDTMTIRNRLESLGIVVRDNGTTLMIKLPGENIERMATIQPDGSIRYMSDDGQLYEVGVVDRTIGKQLDENGNVIYDEAGQVQPLVAAAGIPRAVSPEELSDFGSQSAFGGTLSQASAQGRRYIGDITGRSPISDVAGPISGPIRIGNDFSGFGTAVTSGLLQGAGAVRQQIQRQQQQEAMVQAQNQAAARLQASQTFNLNQVPVQQLTSNGVMKRQLQVGGPTPQPRVYVAPPQAPKNINNVGVAQPKGKVTISTARPQPRVVVR
jgi:hypothetical protein